MRTHTCTQFYTRAYTITCIHSCTNLYTHACTMTRTRTGPKPGFYFKAGPSGLGYYPDTMIYTHARTMTYTLTHTQGPSQASSSRQAPLALATIQTR